MASKTRTTGRTIPTTALTNVGVAKASKKPTVPLGAKTKASTSALDEENTGRSRTRLKAGNHTKAFGGIAAKLLQIDNKLAANSLNKVTSKPAKQTNPVVKAGKFESTSGGKAKSDTSANISQLAPARPLKKLQGTQVKPKTSSALDGHLHYGDNLGVLRGNDIPAESVDLIYLDPPFNSDATYNVLFRAPGGASSEAQIAAFEDTWHWNASTEAAFDEVLQSGNSLVSEMLNALRSYLKENDMMAYLTMMTVRLIELHKVLKPSGSLFLHCDPTASHYLKIILDGIFGAENFRNEIIWRRTGAHNAKKRFGPIHDVIFFYSKSKNYYFKTVKRPYMKGHVTRRYNLDKATGLMQFTSGGNVLTGAGKTGGDSGKPWKGVNPSAKNRHWAIPGFLTEQMDDSFLKLGVIEKLDALFDAGLIEFEAGTAWPVPVRYLREGDGVALQDLWTAQPYTEKTVYGTIGIVDADVAWLGTTAPERLGYPTQKPIGLLDRIIQSACPPNGLVLDPFCGCGTTIHSAQKNKRRWIGIDITHLAISLIEKRVRDAFPGITFTVHGTPKDLDGAKALAAADKYQFQWWAVSLVNAIPYGGKKKGADGGVDGLIYFRPEGKAAEKAVVSVKGGAVGVQMIRELTDVINSQNAKIGLLITLNEPTGPMRTEAIAKGYYDTPFGKYPRIQILTIKDLFLGKKPNIPLIDATVFKKAAVEVKEVQVKLF